MSGSCAFIVLAVSLAIVTCEETIEVSVDNTNSAVGISSRG